MSYSKSASTDYPVRGLAAWRTGKVVLCLMSCVGALPGMCTAIALANMRKAQKYRPVTFCRNAACPHHP